eukprot:COSAG02_NODE_1752_length_11064_cov_16.303785_4_plen_76_part_00
MSSSLPCEHLTAPGRRNVARWERANALDQSHPAVSARVPELDAPRGHLNEISENSSASHSNFQLKLCRNLIRVTE